jgi:homoserine dehydrogenase
MGTGSCTLVSVTDREMTPALGTPLRVGVLGCGNVGAAFVALVDAGADSISGRTGIRLEVTRIAVRDPSRDRPGIDRVAYEKRVTTDAHAIVTDPDIDLVVELIGGVEPARTLILEALSSKKPVVSGNKELLSSSVGELSAAAESAGVDLLFEASVAGAIPLVRLLRESLAGEHIVRLTGIVNGTTNYMLTRMSEEGLGYAEALAEAQALGYAEADPTADVEGYDAAAKAAILAGIVFDADVRAADVHREGITGIERSDIAFAHRLGYEVKLLAIAERSVVPDGEAGVRAADGADAEGGGERRTPVVVRVHPAMVPRDHPLASVRGAFNAVFVESDAAGELMVYGQGAGGRPTASAVLGDVIDAAHHLREGSRARSARRRVPDLRPIAELHSQYYLTLDVIDRPGVLALVASVFGDNQVSIRSMEQTGLTGEARLVFITHTALEADFSATLEGLSALDCVERIGSVLRVIGPEPSGS